ncbi:MAG TPA: hypothetical protein VG899_10020 [Mycobacteriales bacterium]|nr:hypothetical protein [Mycobacteriales bacterium]
MSTDSWFAGRVSKRRAFAWPVGALALAAYVATLTAIAQHTAVSAFPGLPTYSLTGHVAAMVLLGCASVLVAATLWRQAHPAMAALVLAATAAGPMVLVAVPIRGSFVAPTSMDTVWWWHVVVAGCVLALLLLWTLAVVAPPAGERPPRPLLAFASDTAVFTVVAAVGFVVCWNHSWALLESVGGLPALGWALLAAGSTVAVRHANRRTCALIVASLAVAIGLMALVYLDRGGWPQVAGWEYDGMESPVVLSAQVAIVAAAGPALGIALRAVRVPRSLHPAAV